MTFLTPSHSLEKKSHRRRPVDENQLGLFGPLPLQYPSVSIASPRSPASAANAPAPLEPSPQPPDPPRDEAVAPIARKAASKGATTKAVVTRLITVADMPDYPPELRSMVDALIADVEDDLVLFTYRAIKDFFGVSRATVARRMKEGLVPGVSMVHGRVLDDAAVRRFDRVQLRWLLLAVRYPKNRAPKNARSP